MQDLTCSIQNNLMEKEGHGKLKCLVAIAVSFAAGCIAGFMISPAKQGFGNNCGNTYNYYPDQNGKYPKECENGNKGKEKA